MNKDNSKNLNIVLLSSSFSPYFDYWFLKRLQSSTIIDIKVVDITRVALPHLKEHESLSENNDISDSSISTVEELAKFVDELDKNTLVIIGTGGGLIGKIRNRILNRGINVLCDTTFGLPIYERQKNFFSLVETKLRVVNSRLNRRYLKSWLKRLIFGSTTTKTNQNCNAKLHILTAGKKSCQSFKYVNNCKNVVKLYHRSVLDARNHSISSEEHILFVDQAIPVHRDVSRKGYDYSKDQRSYYEDLNQFLKDLEKRYNLPVIVSLHPRHDDVSRGYFENFNCAVSQTSHLISRAKFVVTHFSTCVYDAILLNKPVVLYSNNLINKHHDFHFMEGLSREIGSKIVTNADQIFISIDNVLYDNFKKNYIVENEKLANSDIDEILRDYFYDIS